MDQTLLKEDEITFNKFYNLDLTQLLISILGTENQFTLKYTVGTIL